MTEQLTMTARDALAVLSRLSRDKLPAITDEDRVRRSMREDAINIIEQRLETLALARRVLELAKLRSTDTELKERINIVLKRDFDNP